MTNFTVLKQSSGGRRDVGFPVASPQYGMLPAPGASLSSSPGNEAALVATAAAAAAPAIAIQPNLSQWLGRQLLPDRPPGMSPAAFTATAIDAIVAQQSAFQEQIKQSEANLNAQHAVLIQQQQTQMEETVATAQNEMIQRLAADSSITLDEFDSILQPIIDSCTKDSISTGNFLYILYYCIVFILVVFFFFNFIFFFRERLDFESRFDARVRSVDCSVPFEKSHKSQCRFYS